MINNTDSDFLAELEEQCGETWSALREARILADDTRASVRRTIEEKFEGYALPSDTSLVVFGSLARGEFTAGSDVDWTLFVDGQAYPAHKTAARRISQALHTDNKFGKPSPAGAFGSLAFSHNVIHNIGGAKDTSDNMTQRMLLILESCAVSFRDDDQEAYKRTLQQVLLRYINDDLEIGSEKNDPYAPRFLINDLVRYWRTICVDFAFKERESNEKWAIRNLKLRFSRKLIFVAGLLTGYRVWSDHTRMSKKEDVQDTLYEYSQMTPLEILCKYLLVLDDPEISKDILGAYNAFTEILDNKAQRDTLQNLDRDHAYDDGIFNEGRKIGKRFQKGLNKMFYDKDEDLWEFIRSYGVF